jgi:dipeptidase E
MSVASVRLFLAACELTASLSGEALAAQLAALAGPATRTAIVLNARDDSTELDRGRATDEERRGLGALGPRASELDLRGFSADRPAVLRTALEGMGLVWVTGGNLNLLRAEMARSGFDALVVDRVRDGSLVYAGYSAGSIAAGPALRESHLSHRPSKADAVQWGGLGLVDFTLIPHYRSGGPQEGNVDRIAAHLRSRSLPYVALSDGHALVVDDASIRLIG